MEEGEAGMSEQGGNAENPGVCWAVLDNVLTNRQSKQVDRLLAVWSPQEVFDALGFAELPTGVQSVFLAGLEWRAKIAREKSVAKNKLVAAYIKAYIKRITSDEEERK
jgi:hypothetical protein